MKHFCKVFLVAVMVSLCFGSAETSAQSDSFHMRHISNIDGLNNAFVFDMLEDRHGFIWVAGISGVERFDGHSSVLFNADPGNPGSLPVNSSRVIKEYRDQIWVGTSGGVGVIDPATMSMFRPEVPGDLENMLVADIKTGLEEDLWVLFRNALLKFEPASENMLDLTPTLFRPDSTLNNVVMSRMAIINDSTIWIAGDNRVLHFNTRTGEFSLLEFDVPGISNVIGTNQWFFDFVESGHLILTSPVGVVIWDDVFSSPRLLTHLDDGRIRLADGAPQGVLGTIDGELWLATSYQGLFRIDINTLEMRHHYVRDNFDRGIRENDVHTVMKDSFNNIWIGYHDFGVTVLQHKQWSYELYVPFDVTGPLNPANSITDILEVSETRYWLGSVRGLHLYDINDGVLGTYFPFPDRAGTNFSGNHIGSMFRHNDQIYMFNNNVSFFRFDTRSRTFHFLEDVPDQVYFEEPIIENGRMLLGSVDQHSLRLGWYDLESGAYDSIPVPHLPDIYIEDDFFKALIPLRDKGGNFYAVAVYLGDIFTFNFLKLDVPNGKLSLLEPKLQVHSSISSIPVMSTVEDHVVALKDDRGLLKINLQTGQKELIFTELLRTASDHFPFKNIDDNGMIWIGTRTGVLRMDINGDSYNMFEADPDRKMLFFARVHLLPSGKMAASGDGGFVVFDPGNLVLEMPRSNILITEVRIGDQIINTLYDRSAATLGHLNNNLSLAFTGFNYRSPQQLLYRYRLRGQSDEWIDLGSQRQVYLANLPPGEYTFEVTAISRTGSIDTGMATFSFVISPPWWRTMPAYILFFVLMITGVFTVDRVMRRRVINQERERSREKELAQAREIQKAYDELQRAREKELTQAKEIAQAYENLKAAQEQLVQQEKLASLGQLTAGIAHEIKNPLNFVNNFSSVSMELLDEALHELKSNGSSDPGVIASEVEGILLDVKTNLSKIHEHGSRADSIVKSMLLHSRGGSGKMEPTDLNAVIREYVNLSYHGMRAGKQPIEVDIHLDLDDLVGEVPLISEDFSRVILNLCNNAFDAMREHQERLKSAGSNTGYRPSLRVRSGRSGERVRVDVEDNGPGIPDELNDKILQPFFTTKKGTSGTGLGLSITHDIIKAHGGMLDIDSVPGRTIFTVLI